MNTTTLNSQETIEQECQAILEKIVLPPKHSKPKSRQYDVCIVGGLGHVGLPLGLSLAQAGSRTVLLDINQQAIDQVTSGHMPFLEHGAERVLRDQLNKKLFVSNDNNVISQSYFIIVVIGTPVDEHLNPRFGSFMKLIEELVPHLSDQHHLILRSTVFPGTSRRVKEFLQSKGLKTKVSFCPERIAQSKAIEELAGLPQIISSFSESSLNEIRELFGLVAEKTIELDPLEAELAKLFCNTWRYINFAISNQFFQIALEHNIDFYKVYEAITDDYPRMQAMSKAGFAAGPCLFKDTMQLAAFTHNNFFLGHTAMLINEGLPDFIVRRLKQQYPLNKMTAGILGMAFKANCDDKRESLAYKLKKILEVEAGQVFCSDVYIQDPGFVNPDRLIDKSNIVILAAPHAEYRDLTIPYDKVLIDIWDFYGKGGLF